MDLLGVVPFARDGDFDFRVLRAGDLGVRPTDRARGSRTSGVYIRDGVLARELRRTKAGSASFSSSSLIIFAGSSNCVDGFTTGSGLGSRMIAVPTVDS